MARVRFVDFITSSEYITFRILSSYLTPEARRACSGLEFVSDDSYDWLIILTRWQGPILCPRERVIAIVTEPHWYVSLKNNDLQEQCSVIFSARDPNYIIVQEPSLLPPIITRQPAEVLHDDVFTKAKKCSFIVSNLSDPHNYKLYAFRHRMVRAILDSDLDIDIYGRGWDNLRDPRYKGALIAKEQGLLDYEYSIAIENSRIEDYITEKFWDPILCNTLPIYFGAPNIADIVPHDSYVSLPRLDLNRLGEIISHSPGESQRQAMVQTKNMFYQDYNILLKVADIVKGSGTNYFEARRPQRESIVLTSIVDDAYAMSLAVALYSTLFHLSRECEVHFYLIDAGISERNKMKIELLICHAYDSVHLEWVKPSPSNIKGLMTSVQRLNAHDLRLLIPHCIPARFDKVIYLDADVYVQADLLELWRQDLGNDALLAVSNVPYHRSADYHSASRRQGLHTSRQDFNLGVMVLNLERWRRHGTAQRMAGIVNSLGDGTDDLDYQTFNAVFRDTWSSLQPNWNIMADHHALRQDPMIVHFAGANKPWQLNCQHWGKVQWRRLLQESGWFRPSLTSASVDADNAVSIVQQDNPLMDARVTVVIRTYNRADYLSACIQSVLQQSFTDFKLVVLDSASSDETPDVVRRFRDERLNYIRHSENLGLFGNWERSLQYATSHYLCILADDDLWESDFLWESIQALDENEDAVLSVAQSGRINHLGEYQGVLASSIPAGVVAGMDYVQSVAMSQDWQIHPSAVMFRSKVFAEFSFDDIIHSKQLFEVTFFMRLLANRFFAFLPETLAMVRHHPGQMRQYEFRMLEGTRELVMTGERIEAVSLLMASDRVTDETYRLRLATTLAALNEQRSEIARGLVPNIDLPLVERVKLAEVEISDVIPTGANLVAVDANLWTPGNLSGRTTLPFLEDGGKWFGYPRDSQNAISELERMRLEGAGFIVFAWPAFWWLTYYKGFGKYLRSHFHCVLSNKRLQIFDLRSQLTTVVDEIV